MYEIYTTRPYLKILIAAGLCPRARSTSRAQSKKKNAIRSRSGRQVAPRSPFLSRNYEIASLKDPLLASACLFLSIFFSSSASLPIVIHLSRSSSHRPSLPPSRSPFSLDVIAKSATHYPILPPENQPARYHLSLSFSLSPYAEHTSSYSSSVFIPSRFVLPPTATSRPRRLAQVTAIGNFNARPVSLAERLHPAERLSRRGVASHNRCPNSGSTFSTCLPLRRWSSLYHELNIVHRNLFRNYISIPILSLHGIGVLLLKCFNIFFLLLY